MMPGMMTVAEILKRLEPYTGKFPKKAMRAAIEQREAITPELLRVLETVAENPAEFAKRQNYMVHLFGMFLLAQFRETRAYPILVKIFSAPGETPFDLAGDTVTEGLAQIFASVYDGNPAPLQGLVESEEVNEYVRSAALNTFLVLEKTGVLPRETVLDYLRSLFQGRLQRTPSYAWSSLVCLVADLPAPELLPEVRQAYHDDLVDTGVAHLEDIEQDATGSEGPLSERLYLITDAIAEMEWWASFHPEPPRSAMPPMPALKLPPPREPFSYVPPMPQVREPKIGRNEPCPCGSGKKYKKCCGSA